MMMTDFGTLAGLTRNNSKTKVAAPITRLCSKAGAKAEEEQLLIAAYELLRTTIRNRDAHAYVPNVRASHFLLVPELFSRCFNLLVGWLPDGSVTLNMWRAKAKPFIASQ